MNNPALAKKRREMMIAVRDTVNNLIEAHFPSATPGRFKEMALAFGIDAHPIDDLHTARWHFAVPEHEDMYPSFLHTSYNVSPADIGQQLELSSMNEAEQALRSDLNRLFTGQAMGETFPVVVAKLDGKPQGTRPQDIVKVSASGQYSENGLNVLIYGSPEALYARMQKHLPTQSDLREFVPKGAQIQK